MSAIATPYYRTILDVSTFHAYDEAEFNYLPYDLFCIQTRLTPKINTLLGDDVEMLFISKHQSGRMIQTLQFRRILPDDPNSQNLKNASIILSDDEENQITKWLDEILSKNPNHCLISLVEIENSVIDGRISKEWIKSMLAYIPIRPEFNPFFTAEGIYVMFNKLSDYLLAYNDMVTQMIDSLHGFYLDGVLTTTADLATPWRMDRWDIFDYLPRLYGLTWIDNRFAKIPTDFLYQRLLDDNTIMLDLPENLVQRHFAVAMLLCQGYEGKFIVTANHIRVLANDLSEARTAASLVDYAIDQAEGQVVTISISQQKWGDHLKMLAQNRTHTDCITYPTTNTNRPYVFSCRVDLSVNIESERLALRENMLALVKKM